MFLHTQHTDYDKTNLFESKEWEKKTTISLYFLTPSQLLPASHQQIFST
ncbi:hypothetical protein HMPREF1214_04383 [Bacteroides sp. HPS0048]|nr:hypothetical protein HMPREF1214_04383 [Bacteroides sp. HPS0048]